VFDRIRGEFVDVIEWLDDSRDTMVWRFPRHDSAIKMGAQLTVRESQTAVFVNEGQIADVFAPGRYRLETNNMPILTTLQNWKHGFDSPFKVDVYFVNTRLFTDLKWGTQNPVMMRDAEFGVVRLRAFGAYAARIVDPPRFLTELVGTDPRFRTEEVSDYLRQMIVSRLGPALAAAGVPAIDLVTRQTEIATTLATALTTELAAVGVAIPTFLIENISLPPEVEEALDKRTQMGVLGDLDRYTKLQTANAIEDAANNPGGAGEGVGLGMGMAVGQQMAESLRPQQSAAPAPPATGGPPPLPGADSPRWYLGVGGQQRGPYDTVGLRAAVASGELTPQTLTWAQGMSAWTAAADIPEVAAVLAAAPPPLPPQ
ncbi:MAG: SPFH domain-containing protein, partial [Kineosporiaceae bacterium]